MKPNSPRVNEWLQNRQTGIKGRFVRATFVGEKWLFWVQFRKVGDVPYIAVGPADDWEPCEPPLEDGAA